MTGPVPGYSAKEAVFARLSQLAAAGGPLAALPVSGQADPEVVDVVYEWPGRSPGRICVYLGGVEFERAPDAVDGDDELSLEVDTVGVYVRVMRSVTDDGPVASAERIIKDIARIILTDLRLNRSLGESLTFARLTSGTGDHVVGEDEAIAILAMNLAIFTYAT